MQVLQLPLGIIEGIAHRKMYILVPSAIDIKAVGVDLRTGYDQVNLDEVRRTRVASVTRSFERHMTLCDSLAETLQPSP